MTNPNITDLLNTFQTYWNESLNGDYKNGKNLKILALQIKKLDIKEETLSLTERTIYARALLLSNMK